MVSLFLPPTPFDPKQENAINYDTGLHDEDDMLKMELYTIKLNVFATGPLLSHSAYRPFYNADLTESKVVQQDIRACI